jgi:hypothetical protein
MKLDSAIAAAERTETARQLIARTQTETVELVTVSALELCVLDGPRQPLFDERVAQAWLNRRQRLLTNETTAGMVERGLLTGDSPQRGSGYSLKPELGIMLAARCRPSSIVVTDIGHPNLRTTRFFALGDQAEPVRGFVVEEPTALPADIAGRLPHVKKFGPLGWFYQYFLVSPTQAAEVLVELTISPPRHSGTVVAPGWTVTAYYPGSRNPGGEQLSVQGAGRLASWSMKRASPLVRFGQCGLLAGNRRSITRAGGCSLARGQLSKARVW